MTWPETERPRIGGVGYLLKDRVADVRDFVDAVRRVGDGGTVLDPEVVTQLLARARQRDPLDRLTPRERTVLSLMAEGRSNAAIAQRSSSATERSRSTSATSSPSSTCRPPRRTTAACSRCCGGWSLTAGRPPPSSRHRGRPAWRILASVLTVAALLWGTLNVVNLLAHGERRFTRTFAADAIASVEVSTDRGSVRVIASDRDDVVAERLRQQRARRHRPHGTRCAATASSSTPTAPFPVAYWCTASYTLARAARRASWCCGRGAVTCPCPAPPATSTSPVVHGTVDVDASLRSGSATCAPAASHGSIRLGFASAPMQVVASVAARRRDRRRAADRRGVPRRRSRATTARLEHGVRTDPTRRRTIDASSEHGDVTVRYPAR